MSSEQRPLLSIIIVHYRTPQLLLNCVRSIHAHAPQSGYEVIVVDNDSQDHSRDLVTSAFPQTVWVDMGCNAGFSRANNAGMRKAKGEYALILNPDTELRNGLLDVMMAHYAKEDMDGGLGLLTCRIISLKDGSLLVGTGMGFPGLHSILKGHPLFILGQRLLGRRPTKDYDPHVMHHRDHDADFVSGACILVRMDKVRANNLWMDEDFFLYSEDKEWSYRFRMHGFRNRLCADTEVYHMNSASTDAAPGKQGQMLVSSYLFLYKRCGRLGYAILGLLLWSSHLLNMLLLWRSGQHSELDAVRGEYALFRSCYWSIPRFYAPRPSSGTGVLRA